MRGATHWNISLEFFENPVLLYKVLIEMRPLSTDGAILILELGCMRDFCAFIKSVR